jgi:hypothetical protein
LPKWKYDNLEIWGSAILPEKKEYAKLAIPLTGSKGQALRVFEKKSPHLRFASGSIFFQKTLTAAATLLFNLHIFFSSFARFSFFSFRGKNIVFLFVAFRRFCALKRQLKATESIRHRYSKE